MSFLKKVIRSISLLLTLVMVFMLVGPVSSVHASSVSPVTVTDAVLNSNGTIAVYYTVTRNLVTSGINAETCKVGYRYPAEFRGSIPDMMTNTQTTVGNYCTTLPAPSVICHVSVKNYYQAYTYSEEETIKSIFACTNHNSYSTFHTITAAEANGAFFVYYVVPGVVFTFYPGTSAIVKGAAATYLGFSLWIGFQSTNSWINMPFPATGQYIRDTSYYDTTGNIKKTITMWTNQASYNTGLAPIWQGSCTIPVP